MQHHRPFLRLAQHPHLELAGADCRLQPGERLELGRDSAAFGPGGLADPRISRVHCRVVRLSHGLVLEDLGSRNGTLVNGQPVRRAELEPGDIIGLGHVLVLVCAEPLGEVEPPPPPPGLVTASAAMWPVRRALVDPVHREGPTALVGPSGSGRFALGRTLHELLERTGDLVILPIAGLEDERVRHALHGDGSAPERGALRRAHQGSLFLPGIDAASPAAVQEVLRFLHTGRVEPHTGAAEPVDVKLFVSSSRDLAAAAEAGDLPAELWARLAPRCIVVPSLRERPEDILPLARHLAARHAKAPVQLEPALATQLQLHAWPGNVDELDAIMARIVREQPGSVTLAAPAWVARTLGPDAHDPESTFDPGGIFTAEKP